jgi:hypothetical protein
MALKIKRGRPRKTEPVVAAPEPAAVPAPQPEKSSSGRFVSKSTSRILVAVDSNGLVDFQKMGRDQAKQLRDLVTKSEVQLQLGIGPSNLHFNPDDCKALYDGIGAIQRVLATWFLHYPEPCLAALDYTDSEKEALADPTAKMLDAYAPKILAKHGPFLAWAMVFGNMEARKFGAAGEIARQLRSGERKLEDHPADAVIHPN